jgi:hypothetical protein
MLRTCASGSARCRLASGVGRIGGTGFSAEHFLSHRPGAGRIAIGDSTQTAGDPLGTGYRVPGLSAAFAFLGRFKFELA